MKYIKLFEEYGDKIYDGDEVFNYFKKIGSKHHSKYENPILNEYKEQIRNTKYQLKYININDLISNDIDLEYFINDQYNYYKTIWDRHDVDTYGLIGDSNSAHDVLIDGYHRVIQHLINGDDKIKLFVPLGSSYLDM